jgi:hypothetical protein
MTHSSALEAESRSAGQKFSAFTKPCLSLSCSQKLAICPYNEPDESTRVRPDIGADGGTRHLHPPICKKKSKLKKKH